MLEFEIGSWLSGDLALTATMRGEAFGASFLFQRRSVVKTLQVHETLIAITICTFIS